MKKLGIVLILILILLINGCEKEINFETREVNFETLDKGFFSGHIEKGNYVLTDINHMEDLWKDTYSIVSPLPSPPNINFNQYMVLFVFQGEHNTGGYNIEVTKIVEMKNSIEVHIKEDSPKVGRGGGVIQSFTQPYHIVKLEKLDKSIEFITE